MKTDSSELKKWSDIASKEVLKNTKFKKLKAKVRNVIQNTPDVFTLIQTNQYNTEKHNFEKRMEI